MNANELADYLLNFIMTVEDYDESKHEKAATMLRQQQAEIERLIGAESITYGTLTFCKNCGQQNPYFEKAQEK